MEEKIREWQTRAATLSFDAAMEALSETVARLEEEQLPLEEAEALYLWGRILAARCKALLEEAELRLESLDEMASI